jgi:Fe-S-cluster containining protein
MWHEEDEVEMLMPSKEDQPWLGLLLDAYAVVDRGIEKAIARYQKKSGLRLACREGCSNCCRTHKDIPVYPLELVGIYWYVIEKIKGDVREILRQQLKDFKGGATCPFLVHSSCSIHPMRPIACRQFNVFGNPCREGEDPYYTRRREVLSPPKEITDRAFEIMFPFYGVTDKEEIARFIKHNLMHTQVRVLQSLRWDRLALRMGTVIGSI